MEELKLEIERYTEESHSSLEQMNAEKESISTLLEQTKNQLSAEQHQLDINSKQ